MAEKFKLEQIFKKEWVIVFVVAIIFTVFSVSRASAVQTKPSTATSWYIYVTNNESDQTLYNWMYSVGYQAGQKDFSLPGTQNSLTILDFGQPWQSGTAQGVWSFNAAYGRFISASVVEESVKQFARGYYYGTSSDLQSQMRIAVGTNNYGSKTTYAHGQAWAQLVKNIGAWLLNNSPGSQTTVRGASDIEMGYSSPTVAYSWVNGYSNIWSSPYFLYNYGDSGGCPQSGTTKTPGKCNNNWTQENVQYVSWGAPPSYPIPEIYATTGANAKQWQQISLYSYLAHGNSIYFFGPLSQSQACAQRGGCSGTNNTPDQAWSQLWNALNGDSRTAQNMSWSTDIKWRK